MEYNGYTITEDMYRYWMISWKDYYVSYYSDVEDTEEYWNSLATSELTNEEYLTKNIQTRISYYLVAQSLFDQYALKLDSDAKETIESDLNDKIEYYGSKSACNTALNELYGIDLSTLKKIYTYEAKYTAVYNYLFGTSGVMTSTVSELDEYYHNYYVRAKYVLLLKDIRYVFDEDGKRVTDSTGYYATEDLTEEEQAAVKEEAEEIYNNLLNDVSFEGYTDSMDYYLEKYMSVYYEDITTNYPNGFYITADEYTVHTAAVTEAVFDMEVGEIRLVENESCYFIIKKYDLISKAYSDTVDSDQFTYMVSYCNSEKFSNYFSKLAEGIEINSQIQSSYRLSEL
jgi:hypothetical protein